MSDSTEYEDIRTLLHEGLELSDEEEARAREEAANRRKKILGDITKELVKLTGDQLIQLTNFIQHGCVIPTDDQLTQRVDQLQQNNVALRTENDALRVQIQNLGGAFTTAHTSADEKRKFEGIGDLFKRGDGTYMEPNDVQRQRDQWQSTTTPTTQQMPQTPPQQGQSQQQTQRQGNGGTRKRGKQGDQQGQQPNNNGSNQPQPGVVKRVTNAVFGEPKPTTQP